MLNQSPSATPIKSPLPIDPLMEILDGKQGVLVDSGTPGTLRIEQSELGQGRKAAALKNLSDAAETLRCFLHHQLKISLRNARWILALYFRVS